MTERKFYRTLVQTEVLSESPVGEVGLDTLHYMITEGDCSGPVKTVLQEELDGKQAARHYSTRPVTHRFSTLPKMEMMKMLTGSIDQVENIRRDLAAQIN